MSTRYQNPINQAWNVTSNVGNRVDPVYGYNASHRGIDIAIPVGTPVKAAADGRVIVSKIDGSKGGGYGSYVVIVHNDGTQTVYGHLSNREVKVGQKVNVGDEIGLSGNTGKSTGPHLHFQIMKGDYLKGEVIDPTKVTGDINIKHTIGGQGGGYDDYRTSTTTFLKELNAQLPSVNFRLAA